LMLTKAMKIIKEHINDATGLNNKKLFNFYLFLKHQGRVNKSLMQRKDARMLNVIVPYLMKILELIVTGKFGPTLKFGLVGHLIESLSALNEVWNVDGLQHQIEKLNDIYTNKGLMDSFVLHSNDYFDTVEKFEKILGWIQDLQINVESLNNDILNFLMNHFIKMHAESFLRFSDNFDELKDPEVQSQQGGYSESEYDGIEGGKYDISIDQWNSFSRSNIDSTPNMVISKNIRGAGRRDDVISSHHNTWIPHSHVTNKTYASGLPANINAESNYPSNTSVSNRKTLRPELDESYELALDEERKKNKKKKITRRSYAVN